MSSGAGDPVYAQPVRTTAPAPNARAPLARLLLLALGAGAAVYNAAAFSPLQESLRLSLGLTDNHMAILQGAVVAVPMAILSVPIGLLIDRWNRARLLLLVLLLSIGGCIMTGLASNFAMLLLARACVGIGVPATGMIAVSLIGDLFRPEQRGRAITVLSIVQVTMRSAAFAAGGYLVGAGGGAGDAWRWTALVLVLPATAVAILLPMLREPTRLEQRIVDPTPNAALRELWGFRRLLLPLIAGQVLAAFANTAVVVWAVPAFSRTFQANPTEIGAAIALALLVGGIAGPVLGGPVADLAMRLGGPRRIMHVLAAAIFLSAPLGLFALSGSLFWAALFLTLFLVVGAAMELMCTTVTLAVIPNELRGLAMSVMNGIGMPVTFGLAPLSVSLLSVFLPGPAGLATALSAVAVAVSLAGAAVFGIGSRSYPSTAARSFQPRKDPQ